MGDFLILDDVFIIRVKYLKAKGKSYKTGNSGERLSVVFFL